MRILRVLLLVMLTLSLSVGAAQVTSISYITTQSTGACDAGSCASFPLRNSPSISLQIGGTFSGILSFEITTDGSLWSPASLINLEDGTLVKTASLAGTYALPNMGILIVRARATTWSSGMARVTSSTGTGITRFGYSGGSEGLPVGSIVFVSSGGCPTGTAEATDLNGYTVSVTTVAQGNVGTTGGSDSVIPAGTVGAPTFTGTPNQVTSATSAGTPAGTNSTVAYTPAGTNGAVTVSGSTAAEATHTHSVTAAGTNGTAAFTPAGTNGTVSFTPAGTNGTVSFTPAGTNGTVSFTPAGTIAWPVGVPTSNALTFAGTSFSSVINHTHTVTITDPGHVHVQSVNSGTTGGSNGYTPDTSTSGTSTAGYSTISATTGITAADSNPAGGVSSITPAGTINTPTLSWPAGVPTLAGSSGTVPAQTFTGSAGTVPAETFTGSAGTVPAETFTGSAGTVPAETFTGSAVTSGAGSSHLHAAGTLAASTPSFTGTPGTVPAETFTGSALGTHTHTLTAAGVNSSPTFVGDAQDNRPSFFRVIACRAT